MSDLFLDIESALIAAGVVDLPDNAVQRLVAYLELLVHWNARMNLTAIREPETIIQRHFVESAFVAKNLPAGIKTLLDYGSGAGFPGLPIGICRPEIRVTLAESHRKKASFLRDAVRVTGVSAEVFADRVESLPQGRRFDAVILRAVEKMESAIPRAVLRTHKYLLLMTTERSAENFKRLAPNFDWMEPLPLSGAQQMLLLTGKHQAVEATIDVPRGTSKSP